VIGPRLDYETYLQHDEFGNAPHLLSAEDRVRIEAGDFHRAAGACVCTCGYPYNEHRPLIGARWLVKLCNGALVHL
jgi:hypothetical protein